jgi:hypothetical protein
MPEIPHDPRSRAPISLTWMNCDAADKSSDLRSSRKHCKPIGDVRGGISPSGSFEKEGPFRSSAPRDGTNGPSDSEGSRGARCRKDLGHSRRRWPLTPLTPRGVSKLRRRGPLTPLTQRGARTPPTPQNTGALYSDHREPTLHPSASLRTSSVSSPRRNSASDAGSVASNTPLIFRPATAESSMRIR